MNAPLLVPLADETLSQLWSPLTVQLVFAVTAIDAADAAAPSVSATGVIVRLLAA